MKKLLLLSLFTVPMFGMHCAEVSPEPKHPIIEHLKKAAAPAVVLSGTVMTTTAITGGGCALFPTAALFVGGAYAMKKGYDWYSDSKKQDLLKQAKGN